MCYIITQKLKICNTYAKKWQSGIHTFVCVCNNTKQFGTLRAQSPTVCLCATILFFLLCECFFEGGAGGTFFEKKVSPLHSLFKTKNEKADLVYKSAFCVVRKLSFFLNVQNLLSIIEATNLAYAVILYECITCRVGALVHAGQGKLAIVRASLISGLAHNRRIKVVKLRRSRFSNKKCECVVVWAAFCERSYEGIGF